MHKSIILVAVGIIMGGILTAGTTMGVEAGASGTSPFVPVWSGCLSSKGALSKVGSVALSCTGKTTPMSWNNFPSNGSGFPKCTGAFRDADLSGCDFSGANLVNVDMTDSDLNAANLTGAVFGGNAGANLGSSIWSDTICPDGTNSNNDGNTCANNLTP